MLLQAECRLQFSHQTKLFKVNVCVPFYYWNVSGIQNTLCLSSGMSVEFKIHCFSSGMSVEFKIHNVLVVECQWNSKYTMF